MCSLQHLRVILFCTRFSTTVKQHHKSAISRKITKSWNDLCQGVPWNCGRYKYCREETLSTAIYNSFPNYHSTAQWRSSETVANDNPIVDHHHLGGSLPSRTCKQIYQRLVGVGSRTKCLEFYFLYTDQQVLWQLKTLTISRLLERAVPLRWRGWHQAGPKTRLRLVANRAGLGSGFAKN